MNGPELIVHDFFEAFRPPPKLSLSEWADRYAVLSAESSAEAGRWKTIPYQKGIMDAFTDPAIEQVTVMKSARVGWTKIVNHVIGYHVHQDPCAIMVVQPTIEDAEGYSKEEIAPMIRDTPALAGLVSDAKSKDSANTILHKMFPGGTLSLVGANSARGFRRVSRRVVLFDETDGYPESAGPEGDPIKLAIKRTEYYWNRKIGAGSTPTIKDHSKIERLFDLSDQRRYFVPCPECGEFQYLKWGGPSVPYGMKWPDGEPEKAYYVCEKNGCVIAHDRKREMVERGEWRATAPGSGRHVGFHIWAAYSYSPNASWGQLAKEFLEAKGNTEELKTFVNTALGELWDSDYTARLGATEIQERAETYEPSVVPARALALTAGVDVQDNRLEISKYGWGRAEESWIVSHEVIFGDPAKPEIWKQLESVLFSPHRHELGGEIHISASGIDTGGHFTHEVYQFVRHHRAHPKTKVLALKGQSQKGKPAIGKPTKQDVNFRGQSLKWGVDLYPMGADTIKSVLYARMKMTESGPGYIHFNASLDDEFFEQITSEKKVIRHTKTGFPVTEWIKKSGARNEALDCFVMAYAALQYLYTRYHRKTIWDQFARLLGIKPSPEVMSSQEKIAEPEAQKLQNALRPHKLGLNRRKGGFVGRW